MAAGSKDIQQIVADYDRDHGHEDPVDRRRAELAEAAAAEKRKQQLAKQQQPAMSWDQWWAAVDQRIAEKIQQHTVKWIGQPGRDGQPGVLLEEIGKAIGRHRAATVRRSGSAAPAARSSWAVRQRR